MLLRGRDDDELTGAGAVVGAWCSTNVGAALTTGWAGFEGDDGVFDDELLGLTIEPIRIRTDHLADSNFSEFNKTA